MKGFKIFIFITLLIFHGKTYGIIYKTAAIAYLFCSSVLAAITLPVDHYTKIITLPDASHLQYCFTKSQYFQESWFRKNGIIEEASNVFGGQQITEATLVRAAMSMTLNTHQRLQTKCNAHAIVRHADYIVQATKECQIAML